MKPLAAVTLAALLLTVTVAAAQAPDELAAAWMLCIQKARQCGAVLATRDACFAPVKESCDAIRAESERRKAQERTDLTDAQLKALKATADKTKKGAPK